MGYMALTENWCFYLGIGAFSSKYILRGAFGHCPAMVAAGRIHGLWMSCGPQQLDSFVQVGQLSFQMLNFAA
jgi:hypothetical protein